MAEHCGDTLDVLMEALKTLAAGFPLLESDGTPLLHEALEVYTRPIIARAEKAETERDAVVNLCIHEINDPVRPYWSFLGDFGPIPFVTMAGRATRLEAINAVRKAAGLRRAGNTEAEARKAFVADVTAHMRPEPLDTIDDRTPEQLRADGDDRWPDGTPYVPPPA